MYTYNTCIYQYIVIHSFLQEDPCNDQDPLTHSEGWCPRAIAIEQYGVMEWRWLVAILNLWILDARLGIPIVEEFLGLCESLSHTEWWVSAITSHNTTCSSSIQNSKYSFEDSIYHHLYYITTHWISSVDECIRESLCISTNGKENPILLFQQWQVHFLSGSN